MRQEFVAVFYWDNCMDGTDLDKFLHSIFRSEGKKRRSERLKTAFRVVKLEKREIPRGSRQANHKKRIV